MSTLSRGFFALIIVFPSATAADTVLLRDGTVIRNARTRLRADHLLVRMEDGRVLSIPRRRVRRIKPGPIRVRSPRKRKEGTRYRRKKRLRKKVRSRGALSLPGTWLRGKILVPGSPVFAARYGKQSAGHPGHHYWAFMPVFSPLLKGESKWSGFMLTLGKLTSIYYINLYSNPTRIADPVDANRNDTASTGILSVALASGNPLAWSWAAQYLRQYRDPLNGSVVSRRALREKRNTAFAVLAGLILLDFQLTRVARANIALRAGPDSDRGTSRISAAIRFEL